MTVTSQPSEARPETQRRMRREIGPIGILFTSVGIVIGSGWLFGALKGAEIAGPAALLSWLIGAIAILILGLNLAELGGMYAVAGGLVRFPHFAFGSMVGFASGWFFFLATVTVAPIETEAALTYASNYIPGLLQPGSSGNLTLLGLGVAAIVMFLFTILNVAGVRWMSEVNKYAVWWKIAIPLLTVIVLVVVSFHPGNFTAGGGFIPLGVQGIFIAVSTGGIVFAYTGFEGAVSFGAESRNPGRDIPLAVIGSMAIGFIIYIGLQIAFIAALQPSALSKGWSALQFKGSTLGPFAALAETLGLSWLAILLYIDAVVSPGGTGLLSLAAAARTIFALARNRYIPDFFAGLTTRGVPLTAIVLSFVLGLFVFLPFPGWGGLVGFISSAAVITYALVPLSVGALRLQEPDRPRPFRLPAASVLAPLGFIVANELILFASFAVVWKLIVAILIGFALLAISLATTPRDRRPSLDWDGARWLWPWLIGLLVISFLSSFDLKKAEVLFGVKVPLGWLGFGVDMAVMAIFAAVIYYLAMRVRLAPERATTYVRELTAEEAELPETPAA
ncbi:MAG: APC family permease [Candidatus Dormibacter sp.]|uniref:APC family permease n=1 Tax=Candidatus Dormibacter sp. TaxID=2973982 RepID=UPI0026B9A139